MNSYDDEQVLAYLAGDGGELPPSAELDDLRALLADPLTWELPPPSLADDVVAAVAVAASTAPRPVPAPAPAIAPVVVPLVAPRRRPAAAGLAAAAVAASLVLGTAIGFNLDGDDTTGPAQQIAAAGQAQPLVPQPGLPSVAVTNAEKERFTPSDDFETADTAGFVGTAPDLGRFPGVLYWLGAGPDGSARLSREVAQLYDKNGRATGALRALLNRKPADADFRSPWPAGSSGEVVASPGGAGDNYPAGTVFVYLNSAALKARASAAEARAAVQQVVWTMRANDPTISAVVLTATSEKDRKSLATQGLWRSGETFASPVRAGDPAAVLAPVQIDGPTEAASLDPGTFAVSGAAISPNGRIRWEVLDRGQVVRSGEAATAAAGGLSPYSFQVSLAPGRYTIVVYPSLDGSAGSSSRVVDVKGTAT